MSCCRIGGRPRLASDRFPGQRTAWPSRCVGRTLTPRQHWVLVYDTYAALDVERRNPALLQGFLRGLRVSNKSIADELLDGLVTDSVLGPIFPYIQGWPSDDTGGDRLILSVAHGQAPARRFYLGTKRLDGDGLSAAKYCEVVRRVATMPEGLAVAFDSVSMEYHWFSTRKIEIPEPLVLLGRDLLDQFMFDSSDHNLGYRLKELAKVCFQGDDAATSVRSFASRFAAALDDYRTHADAYGELGIR